MERIVAGVTAAHGARYALEFERGYHSVINDAGATDLLRRAVLRALGPEALVEAVPNMGGEDFSAYQQRAAGSFFFIGARNEERGIVHPHHHERFDFDERALDYGLASSSPRHSSTSLLRPSDQRREDATLSGVSRAAAIPAIGMLAGIPFANRVEPYVLGLPFLLFWIVAWVVATSLIMGLIWRSIGHRVAAREFGAGRHRARVRRSPSRSGFSLAAATT